MNRTSRTRMIVTLLCAAVLGGCVSGATFPAAAAENDPPKKAQSPVPIEVQVSRSPALARLDGGAFLVYELHLTNFYSAPWLLEQVDVLSADEPAGEPRKPMRTWEGESLAANLKHLVPPAEDDSPLILGPGLRAVLFLWVPVESASAAPEAIDHRIVVRFPGGDTRYELVPPSVPVRIEEPVTIAPPVTGGPWVVGNGPSAEATPVHNRLFYPRAGKIFVPQRFATDWVVLGKDMRSVRGDITRNESYSTWGVPVLAVADGEIVDVRSDVPENTPPDVSTPLTAYTVQGNYVILSIGADKYAAYLHLKPGSVMVKPGDRVSVGQPLALIGNTGNSTSAHLHFHVLDHPSIGQGEGVPFVFTSYRSLGPTAMDLDDIEGGKPWTPVAPHEGVLHTFDLPAGETVVRFE